MLKLTIIEFFIRIIPEGLLFVLAMYIFSNKKIEKKPYFIASMLLSVGTYLVRILPIQFGVHTIIIIMISIIITTLVNKINVMKSISSSMICMAMLSICESINLFILNLLQIDIKAIIGNPITKNIYFMPSLFLFGLFVLLVHTVMKKAKKNVMKGRLD